MNKIHNMSRIGTKKKMEKDYRKSILQLPIRLVKANYCIFRNFARQLSLLWWLKIGHGKSNHLTEVKKHYKPNDPILPTLSHLLTIYQNTHVPWAAVSMEQGVVKKVSLGRKHSS